MINIVLENEKCMPYVADSQSAGMDLRMDSEERFVSANEEVIVSTGVRVEVPKGWVGLVLPRSGLGFNYKLRLFNTTGVIDHGYTGVIKVAFTIDKERWFEPYERICQMVIVPHYILEGFNIVESLEPTERGDSGFGSSGTV